MRAPSVQLCVLKQIIWEIYAVPVLEACASSQLSLGRCNETTSSHPETGTARPTTTSNMLPLWLRPSAAYARGWQLKFPPKIRKSLLPFLLGSKEKGKKEQKRKREKE